MYLKVLKKKSIYTCTYIIYVFYSINIYIIYTYATPGHQGLNNHAYFPCLVCSENNQNSSFPRITGYQCAVHGVVLVACWDLLNLHWRENCTTSIPFYMCVKMSCFCYLSCTHGQIQSDVRVTLWDMVFACFTSVTPPHPRLCVPSLTHTLLQFDDRSFILQSCLLWYI